ncbi:hypothetical protein OH76DRAFT_805506 [Lentinus brumalis]|uniref:Uncharacterized protein n=1 Tax=Lentinus brumalis TaxID=2498619 RepID=A0A371D2Z1_9APHY|nr:hypothetical protein OH76DRAFT_805506 [Polyporus brumalis]
MRNPRPPPAAHGSCPVGLLYPQRRCPRPTHGARRMAHAVSPCAALRGVAGVRAGREKCPAARRGRAPTPPEVPRSSPTHSLELATGRYGRRRLRSSSGSGSDDTTEANPGLTVRVRGRCHRMQSLYVRNADHPAVRQVAERRLDTTQRRRRAVAYTQDPAYA